LYFLNCRNLGTLKHSIEIYTEITIGYPHHAVLIISLEAVWAKRVLLSRWFN